MKHLLHDVQRVLANLLQEFQRVFEFLSSSRMASPERKLPNSHRNQLIRMKKLDWLVGDVSHANIAGKCYSLVTSLSSRYINRT